MAAPVFDWQQYLIYAEQIDLNTASEAERRSAVSRAYYAAYWKARRRIEKQGASIARQDAHNQVWDAYEFVIRADNTSLRTLGNDLKNKRTWADYNSRYMSMKDAEAAILDASELIQDLTKLT